ncbi:MAG: hypothetical protein AAGD13_08950 [Pseudomonadota bacterium]
MKRYRFDEAVLIEAIQPGLLRQTIIIVIFCVVFVLMASYVSTGIGFFIGIAAGGGWGYWYINDRRETILVRDLLHGRHFTRPSVVDRARKEAWLTTVTAFLRQVIESAKHWDGTERHTIEPLPKDEARRVILKGV